MNSRVLAQLALVHVGVSITVVPVTSTLNRVMIADMQMPVTMVAVLVALPYLLSPLQIFLGNWSDRHPAADYHRTPWILLGGLIAATGSYFTVHVAYLLDSNFMLGLGAAVVVFCLWGAGINAASVSYLSLVTDLADEEGRSRAVSIMWTAMIAATIVTAYALSLMLEAFSKEKLFTAFGAIWFVSVIFVLVGSYRIEPRASARTAQPSNSADDPLLVLRLLALNPQARRFFLYLMIVLISIHAQDVLLEPFGAEALGMSVSVTSRLTSIWGTGLFITLLAGILFVKRYGKKSGANLGACVTAVAFAAIIATGLFGQSNLFLAAVFLLGLGGGLMTVSNLSFMLDMTLPQAAGLYIGAWSVANFAGQAVGNIISGILWDLFYWLTGNSLLGYAAVFSLEIVGLLLAVWLFRSISVEQFRRQAELRLHTVLSLASD
ncbi:MAG: BCD family MFS transporter [Caldilineaceae bacterium SB0664_bin_27]|uniref:BCD family MFS transporter n=1 Tax=Caldilineaceae bacterium SB0664_bin_27 TaxID=2605260 RepID=A0A6B0YV68_9CHLR|nr:BCD family MFS transporter [Caldilineaceae bacterium SB0664_bin_27]